MKPVKLITTNQKTSEHNTQDCVPSPAAGPKGLAITPPQDGLGYLDHGSTIQRKSGHFLRSPRREVCPPNRTGLPDALKTGVESLSGLSLDDVHVHYNSPRPAQLQALAYTQGSEIHVAPGQERHLPHEAWHVVQQKQGRVRPTFQMKGFDVNDDLSLEMEADRAARRYYSSSRMAGGPAKFVSNLPNPPIQRMTGYFEEQKKRWLSLKANELAGKMISVGFEFDIGIMDEDTPLQGISHLELLTGEFPNNPVPSVLETDAGNILELATSPYLLETQPNKPWPTSEEVDKAIAKTQDVFKTMPEKGTINTMADKITEGVGVEWKAKPLSVTPANWSTRANKGKVEAAVKQHNVALENQSTARQSSNIMEIPVKRNDDALGNPQINILTDAEHLESVEQAQLSRIAGDGLHKLLDDAIGMLTQSLEPITGKGYHESNVTALRRRIANTIVQHAMIRPMQTWALEKQNELAKGKQFDDINSKTFRCITAFTSFIKDYSNVWLKTDLVTYLRGRLGSTAASALSDELDGKLKQITSTIPFRITPKTLVPGPVSEEDLEISEILFHLLKNSIGISGEMLQEQARLVLMKLIKELKGPAPTIPTNRTDLFDINQELLGARHDTHLEQNKLDDVAGKLGYQAGKLHVVEIRASQEQTIKAGNEKNSSNSRERQKE